MVFFKKKRQNKLYGEHKGGASTTGICGERIPDGRTSSECSCERLQRPDSYNKSVIVGIIDPEGYDKENRVYSGGGLCPTLLVGNGRIKVVSK